eukprot:scaffold210338_cov23-Tisochrysis_lutea.AAC.1
MAHEHARAQHSQKGHVLMHLVTLIGQWHTGLRWACLAGSNTAGIEGKPMGSHMCMAQQKNHHHLVGLDDLIGPSHNTRVHTDPHTLAETFWGLRRSHGGHTLAW